MTNAINSYFNTHTRLSFILRLVIRQLYSKFVLFLSGPDISDIADIEGKDKIDLEEVVTDADAKDQEQEHIKMLLDEMIQNVTDPDKNKPFCDDLDTKCLKSNRTEDMETIDSDRIAQHANNDSLPSQDTQYTGIEKKALSADNGSVTVKLEEAISLVVAAESIESTMDKDSDLSPVQHKFNLDISLPRTQEAGETNVVCDSQIDTEVVHERKGRLTDIILTSDSDENRKTCDSPPITNKSMNTEESMNVIVSSETEMIADKSCDMNSTAVKDENSTIVDKGVHKAFPGET